jgi:hypothetical protein
MVTFETDAEWSLLDRLRIEDESQTLAGRRVDMPTRADIETMENWVRRKNILSSAGTIFEAV